jgi:hypothetical protein
MCESCSPKDRRDRSIKSVPALHGAALALATVPVGSLTDATRTALTAAGKAETPEGALALYMAAQLDAGAHTGSQTAALGREYRAALELAMKGATAGGSTALDELRARRAARRGA